MLGWLTFSWERRIIHKIEERREAKINSGTVSEKTCTKRRLSFSQAFVKSRRLEEAQLRLCAWLYASVSVALLSARKRSRVGFPATAMLLCMAGKGGSNFRVLGFFNYGGPAHI